MNTIQAKNRIGWIDIAKAIGILFVLINHVELGLGVVTFLGGMFYMPVFFVLSGYTYKEKSEETIRQFILNKARRLLVPYVCFQVVMVGLFTLNNLRTHQSVKTILLPIFGAVYSRNALFAKSTEVIVSVPSTNIDLMPVLNAPLWFLTGLFSTLVLYKVMMVMSKGNKKKEWVLLGLSVLTGVALKYLCPALLPWSMDTACLGVLFVHAGRCMKSHDIVKKMEGSPIFSILLLFVFVGLSYLNGSGNMSIREFGHSTLLYLVVGITGSLSVMLLSVFIEKYIPVINSGLELIGRHTIGILAFHLLVFTLAGIVFTSIGSFEDVIEMVAKIIISVVILVPMDWFIQKYLPFVYGK